jgi:hypothetical protein
MRAMGSVTVGPDDPEAEYTVPVRAFHVHEVCALRERFDIASSHASPMTPAGC